MDALEQFLSEQAEEEEKERQAQQKSIIEQPASPAVQQSNGTEATFGDKLGYDEQQTFRAIQNMKRFDESLENRYYHSIRKHKKPAKKRATDSILHRIDTYKYTKSQGPKRSGPIETKIHNTPLSYRSMKFSKIGASESSEFVSQDPRFAHNPADKDANKSGWKIRNAYTFLDDMMDRDIAMIEKKINRTKKQIKYLKNNKSEQRSERIATDIQSKGAAIQTLQSELVALKNRRHRVREADLEQQSKAQMRKMEIDQVRQGVKTPYYHKFERTRFGEIKWNKKKRRNDDDDHAEQGESASVERKQREQQPKVSIQSVYLEKKYNRLKSEGKLEKYIKKKAKRVNSKFRGALAKKSGRGWNDTV